MLATGIVTSITFFEIDIDPAEVAGISFTHKTKPPYSVDEHVHLFVIYSGRLPDENQRVVVCKEILHALDSEDERASTREKVEKLIDEIVLPHDIAISLPTRSDRVGILNALRVLIPRDAMTSEFKTDKIRHFRRSPAYYDAYDVLREDKFGDRTMELDGRSVFQRPHRNDGIRERFRGAWLVWTGRADILHWRGQETFTTYPDHGD